MSIKHDLVDEFHNEIKELAKAELGSEQHVKTADTVVKLADRIIDLDKLEAESNLKIDAQNKEYELKVQQLKDDKHDRFLKNAITLGLGITSLVAYIWGYKTAMVYEDKGLIPTTEGGKNSIRQLLKLKF